MKPLKIWQAHGDILVLVGRTFQTLFTHELPPEPGVESGRVGVVLRARELQPNSSGQFGRETPRKRRRAVSSESLVPTQRRKCCVAVGDALRVKYRGGITYE